MKINLVSQGLLDQRRFDTWRRDTQQAMRKATARVMRESGQQIASEVRVDMASGFRSVSPAFLRSMRSKVFDRKPSQFPALYIGSKIPWLGIHMQGGTIRGRMLIPLLPEGQRVGRKAFARIVNALMRSGNAWFIEKSGQRILMAENLAENAAPLARFRRAERVRSGLKRLPRTREIPIAVLVRSVTLKRRFDLFRVVRSALPRLSSALSRALRAI